eukprot:14168056-Alexandrium_andersonii.AAC.1
MSASLVGSEMCIRDSRRTARRSSPCVVLPGATRLRAGRRSSVSGPTRHGAHGQCCQLHQDKASRG